MAKVGQKGTSCQLAPIIKCQLLLVRMYIPHQKFLQEKNNQFVVGTKFMLVLISQNILFLSQDAHFRFICSDLRTTPSAVDHLVPKQQKSIMMGNHTAQCPSSKLQIALGYAESFKKAKSEAQSARRKKLAHHHFGF